MFYKRKEKKAGCGGHRSRYLSHAKRSLYHLSYTPSKFIFSFQKLSLQTVVTLFSKMRVEYAAFRICAILLASVLL